jgi:hypothetical protein
MMKVLLLIQSQGISYEVTHNPLNQYFWVHDLHNGTIKHPQQKKFVAFNMKHRKWSFSRIELNCKEGMKMYVDGARVITTVNI